LANIGYARVSTADQDTALQLDALASAGCGKTFEDRASGAQADRIGLREALAYVREGDVLVTWKLDRLGRSLPHLIETVAALERRGVGFRSITEAIDTTTSGGRLVFHLFGALGQFERFNISSMKLLPVSDRPPRSWCPQRPPTAPVASISRGHCSHWIPYLYLRNRHKITASLPRFRGLMV